MLGSLVLGGFDRSRFSPSNISFSFSSDDSRGLTVGVQSIVGFNTLLGAASFTSTSGGHLSFIDSTVPHIWLPRAVCDAFENAFGLRYDPTTDLYLVNDTIRSRLLQLNPTVTFKLGNMAFENGNNTNIVLPYAAFDLQASWPIYENSTSYFPIRRAQNDTQYTLGRTFLQEAYLVVDHERRNFTVRQAIFQDPSPPRRIATIMPPGTINSSNNDGKSSATLSGGAIGGIVVGAIALFALLIVGAFFIRRNRRRRLAEMPGNEQLQPQPSGSHKGDKYHGTASELGGTTVQELESPPPHLADKKFDPYSQQQTHTHELPSAPLLHELPAENWPPSRADNISQLQ